MNNNNAANLNHAYLQQQVANASPAQQLVMLLDGVAKFVIRAKEAIAAGDVQERFNNNRRAMEIIAHLLSMIDASTGGEAAIRLRRIYGYMMRRITDIDFKNDPAVCDEVIGHLQTMRSAWAGLAQESQAKVEKLEQEPPIIRRSAVA